MKTAKPEQPANPDIQIKFGKSGNSGNSGEVFMVPSVKNDDSIQNQIDPEEKLELENENLTVSKDSNLEKSVLTEENQTDSSQSDSKPSQNKDVSETELNEESPSELNINAETQLNEEKESENSTSNEDETNDNSLDNMKDDIMKEFEFANNSISADMNSFYNLDVTLPQSFNNLKKKEISQDQNKLNQKNLSFSKQLNEQLKQLLSRFEPKNHKDTDKL